MKIAIVGSGLAGLTAAVNLVDEGHEVEIYESRSFWGGKVGSWEDKDGNHIEMGLHVFFYNYANLFKLMKKVGALDNLLPKDHTHLFINNGGNLKSLDFRFPLGAPFNGLKAFFTTEQLTWVDKFRNALALGTSPIVRGLIDYEGAMKIIRDLDRISFKEWFLNHGGSEKSLERMWDPIAYALGFINCKDISARCMLTIVPGIKKIIPKEWYQFKEFEGLKKLRAVAVATIQLRYDGWVTELQKDNTGNEPIGLDNLLYSADASFSCFADLALASPADYRKKDMGSLLQCVLTPGDRWMGRSTERITKEIDKEVRRLFPSSKNLKLLWSNVVQIPQSLYREAPGMEPFRPDQKTSISNFFMAGSYTKQDYIDSMEGATMSGHLAAAAILEKKAELAKNLAVS